MVKVYQAIDTNVFFYALYDIGWCALSSDNLSKVRTFPVELKSLNVNGLLVLKLLQLTNGDFICFVMPAASKYKLLCLILGLSELKARPNLGHGMVPWQKNVVVSVFDTGCVLHAILVRRQFLFSLIFCKRGPLYKKKRKKKNAS